MICQILRLFANILAAMDKYPVLNKDKLTRPIQMQLSQKQKPFSGFFEAFSKSELSFEPFEKKDDPHKFFISEIKDSENMVT